MGVCVVFAGAIVPVRVDRFMRSKFFQPLLVIVVQAGFIIIDKNRGGYVHGVNQARTIMNATFAHAILQLMCYVNEAATIGEIVPKFLTVGFHVILSMSLGETEILKILPT